MQQVKLYFLTECYLLLLDCIAQTWTIVTDVTRSMVCVSVCCAHGRNVQKLVNGLRCHFGD